MSEINVDTIAGSGGTTVTIKSGHTLTLVENLDAGSNKLTNVTDPTSAQDAATKNYVDTQLLTLDTLGELTDVTISSVGDNEVLAYDSSSGHFINQTASEAGLATSGNLTTHTSATSNPHTVTVDQVFAGGIPTGDLNINSNKLTNVTNPSSAQDAATKNYVDTQVAGKDALSELSGTSDDVAEGTTNLYFTNERVDDRFNSLFQDGTALTGTYDDASNTYTLNLDSLTVSEFAASAIVLESEGLNSSDSDSSIPTTAAVKDYVDTEVTNAVTGGSTLSSATLNKDDNTVITEYQVTVADDGSGSQNVFFYDGEKESRLNLQAGETVRFILSDSSVASHPFALSITKDGSHGGGSEYTTGQTVNGSQGSAGAYIDYVIDAGSADTLYPYCETHSGMGGDSVFISGKYINEDSSSTLTNKSIDSDNNTITNIVNADIKSNAAIAQSKLSLDITDSEINASAAIDATKIADGSVTSTEFQFIGGLTSDAQTQLDAKATTSDTLDEFGNPVAALDINDQELTKFVAKDFAEDIATTSDSGTSFTGNTLTADVQDGNIFAITLDANITTWTISNLLAGKATTLTFILTQDGTGGRTAPTQINSTTIKTVDGGGLTLSTGANDVDIVTVVFDGTNYYVFSQLNMS
jgi:predicted secreted protein